MTNANGLSEAERATWDVDPDEWPHTPPLHIFRALYEEDDNLWWRAGSGHGQNAYDAALEEIDRVSAAATRARAEGAAEAGERIVIACELEHGNNVATAVMHHGSNRTCIRLKATNQWIYDPDWEA